MLYASDASPANQTTPGCRTVVPGEPPPHQSRRVTQAQPSSGKVQILNPSPDMAKMQDTARRIKAGLSSVILDKERPIEYLVVALCCGSNVLLEDVPGVGKTTLAKALARLLHANFHRIQFTPDLLPADILGGSIYNPQTGEFYFRPGPIFANIILADEINRASPRTQSALLEAMTEGHATVEGAQRSLPKPFVVIATQNPVEFHGTFPLPEAQLDRFMLRIEIGYPDEAKEMQMLYQQKSDNPLELLEPVTDCQTLMNLQEVVRQVSVEESVAKYMVAIVRATRHDSRLRLGASPRAALMLFRASQALAFLRDRDFVVPDDVREMAVPVLAHRLMMDTKAKYSGSTEPQIVKELVEAQPVPV